jgi:serine phosphatase RsbU (regulator of sigma subunit)
VIGDLQSRGDTAGFVAAEPHVTGAATANAGKPTSQTASVRSQRWPFWLPLGVLIVGLVVTGALALVSYGLYTKNEKRLLSLRVRQVGSVLAGAMPGIQTPLASAAALADATNGDVQKFKHFVAPYVGVAPAHQFVSVSLWRVGAPQDGPIAVVGTPPALSASPARARAFFARAAHRSTVSVVGFLGQPAPRLGYGFATPESTSRFAAYGESLLPSDRRSRLQSNSAFSDLDYALYLGASERPADLLVTSLSHPPIRGRQAKTMVPFGDTVLTLVVAPRHALAGSFPQRLPWIVVIVGIVLSLGAAALTVRLIERRRGAEHLAERLEGALSENQRLYGEQRNIAQTLQHALVPDELPQIRGVETSARYEPGEQGLEVGGDWYDVIPLAGHRLLVVVGDVTGRGLQAAATMASLRYAIHAYAAQGDPPAAILTKLSKLLNVSVGGQLATVLCVMVDVDAGRVTVTSAGHLPPLLISGDQAQYVESEIGLPIGVENGVYYSSTTVSAAPDATLLAFTDGLVERRGESLDRGLARLREAAVGNHAALPELLSQLVTQLRYEPSEDDTAIVGLRWSG